MVAIRVSSNMHPYPKKRINEVDCAKEPHTDLYHLTDLLFPADNDFFVPQK